jgi:hypothetical protein
VSSTSIAVALRDERTSSVGRAKGDDYDWTAIEAETYHRGRRISSSVTLDGTLVGFLGR